MAPPSSIVICTPRIELSEEQWDGGSGGYLAWVGRYDIECKGIDLLIDAVGMLPSHDRPSVRLRGIDYRRNTAHDVQRLVKRRGLQQWIDVGPSISDAEKLDFLRRAAGFIHPSRWDAYPRAVLEALSIGVPCLVTRNVMLSPKLEDARAAIVTAATAPAIANGLRELRATGQELGNRGRMWVQARLAEPNPVDHFIDRLQLPQ
jgi:glycosyltransferase involved in cell wall biosynthesis